MNIVIDLRPLMGGRISGVEVYIHNLLKYLLPLDHSNNYILFTNASKDQSAFLPKIKQENILMIQTKIPNKLLNCTLSILRRPKLDQLILRAAKKLLLTNSPKISKLKKKRFANLNSIDIFFMPDLRPSAFSKNTKKITVIHDLSFHHFPQFFSAKTRLWYKLLRPCREIATSSRIITVSEFTKNDLVSTYNIPSKKIEVIYEGVEENFGRNITPENFKLVQKKYHLPPEYFLFLSTLEPRKNMKGLIEAFQLYKKRYPKNKIKLIMAGIKNPKIFSSINLQGSDDILFPGFIEEHDKAAVMQRAKAFLYPSLFEGFGLPLVEAMKCNTPIITSNLSSMPEMVGQAALLIDPHNIPELAEALHIVQDSRIQEKLRFNMQQQIKNFSWEKCAKETLKIFH